MFFLQEATPDTSGYMIAGYAVAFIVMGLYVFSLYLRNRNLQQDLKVLEEMEQTSVQVQAKQPQPKPQKVAKSVTKKRPQKQP